MVATVIQNLHYFLLEIRSGVEIVFTKIDLEYITTSTETLIST